MPYHNHIELIGHAGRDAETKQTAKGDDYARFTLAVSRGTGDAKKTLWFKVSAFGRIAEWAGNVRKGQLVHIAGELDLREYQGKDGGNKAELAVLARTVNVLSPRSTAEDTSRQPRESGAVPPVDDDDFVPPF